MNDRHDPTKNPAGLGSTGGAKSDRHDSTPPLDRVLDAARACGLDPKHHCGAWECPLVDRRGAARLLGVSAGSIDNLRTRGELPSLKIGARRLYDTADLRRYIDSRKAVQQ